MEADHPVELKQKIIQMVKDLGEKLQELTLLLNKNKTDVMLINSKRFSLEEMEVLSSINIRWSCNFSSTSFQILGSNFGRKAHLRGTFQVHGTQDRKNNYKIEINLSEYRRLFK